MKRMAFVLASVMSFLLCSESSADTMACDAQGCISEEKFLNSIVGMLNNNVTGYVVIVGSLPPAVGGQARTSSDSSPPIGMSANLPMNIASVSKTLTAVATLQLLANFKNGSLPIGSKIGPYIYQDWKQGPNISNITFQQLLTHTSGLGQINGCGDDNNYASLKALVAAGVPTAPPGGWSASYGNCNFSLLRELFPGLLGQSITNQPDTQRAQTSSNIYITYMNQQVFAPLGIKTVGCKPVGNEILWYPFPPESTNGIDWGDLTLACGAGGWELAASDLFKVINDLATGNVLLTDAEKAQMNSAFLGWDNSVRGDCPNPYVCKNGGYGRGNIGVSTYAGIFKSKVPVIVYVNSFIPYPYQTFGDIIALVADAYNCAGTNPPANSCACVPAAGNGQFALNTGNTPLQITQGGDSAANLVLEGSWVAADHAVNAVGTYVGDTLPQGSTVSLSPGFEDWYAGDPHTGGLMEILVYAPLSTRPGPYCVLVKARDLVSNQTVSTAVPIQVVACKPISTCPTNVGLCGSISNGCGGTVNCGACGAGLICSNSQCCKAGYFYNTLLNVCEPSSCPPGTSYCYPAGACTTDAACQRVSNKQTYCERVNGRLECQ